MNTNYLLCGSFSLTEYGAPFHLFGGYVKLLLLNVHKLQHDNNNTSSVIPFFF